MKCRRCGFEHKCARSGCGHSKFENHGNGKSYCNWRKHGAVLGCNCGGYVESDHEKLCRVEAEAEMRWPIDAVNALKEICELQHHSNPMRPKLLQLLALGERLVAKEKIVVQPYI